MYRSQELEQIAAAAAGRTVDAKPNIGRAAPMQTVPAAGGLVTLADTQLISMRIDAPRQWLVTILQSCKQQYGSPWPQDFDGAAYSPPTIPPASVFGAPSVPQQVNGVTVKLQGLLRWGAGGITAYTKFDWPMAGGVFGLTADTFDLSVFVSAPAAQQGMPPDLVPVVAAFMVPGQAADREPLRWEDVAVNVVAAGLPKDWSVKPYARSVQLLAPGTAKLSVSWLALNGNGLVYVLGSQGVYEEQAGEGVNSIVEPPPAAVIMRVFNPGAADSIVTPIWRIGLV